MLWAPNVTEELRKDVRFALGWLDCSVQAGSCSSIRLPENLPREASTN
jgi:hypothetical protein